jgi:uncharacterized protein (TIGR03000 family)
MTLIRTSFVAVAVAVVVWLATANPVQAYYRPPITPVTPSHMPGWDWWRTYPWSPYNYGRNPYNPIILPYQEYVYPYYPLYAPPPTPPAATTPAVPESLQLPTISGPLTTPPPGTAIIRVRVPDTWGEVAFNGHDSITSGKLRTFVTPRLTSQGTRYTVSASFAQQGQVIDRQQQVRVVPGQIVTLDFTR